MKFQVHSLQKMSELDKMLALARVDRGANLHTTDLPYRFSSWALDDPDNIALWCDSSGLLCAWAVLQTPFWFVDSAIHPGKDIELFPEVLQWAERRALAVQNGRYGHPAWFCAAFPHQRDRIAALQAAGWENQKDVPENAWSKVWMKNPLEIPLGSRRLPPGFSMDCFTAGDVDAYVGLHRAAFNSKNMTTDWRQRVVKLQTYQPDLNLVIYTAEGFPAAFCIGWLDAGGRAGQVEPMGVHPDYQRMGLGRAVLAEILRRFRAKGVEAVYVETDNYRDGAFSLYASTGFSTVQEVFVFRKDLPESNT